MFITLRKLKAIINETILHENATVTAEDALEIVKKFPKGLKKLGIDVDNFKSYKVLGTGTRGTAFLVGDKVFKITNDAKEAQAASVIQGKNEKSLVNVYSVVHFADTEYYGILQEKLDPLPDDIGKEYNQALIKTAVPVWIAKSNGDWNKVKEMTKDHIRNKIKEKFGKDAEVSSPEVREFVKSVNESWNLLVNTYFIRDMFNTLQKYGIRFHDFHAGNLMIRGDGQLVLIDLGMSKVQGTGDISTLSENLRRAAVVHN
jgi:serine/threonine protein kinase